MSALAIAEIGGRCRACGSLLVPPEPEPEPEPRHLTYGPLALDLLERTARVGDVVVVFPGTGALVTWPLLVLLARASGDLVTREAQAQALYGTAPDRFVRHCLNVNRQRLRAKLAPLGVGVRACAGVGCALEVPRG